LGQEQGLDVQLRALPIRAELDQIQRRVCTSEPSWTRNFTRLARALANQ
jgi:hypothetical protein